MFDGGVLINVLGRLKVNYKHSKCAEFSRNIWFKISFRLMMISLMHIRKLSYWNQLRAVFLFNMTCSGCRFTTWLKTSQFTPFSPFFDNIKDCSCSCKFFWIFIIIKMRREYLYIFNNDDKWRWERWWKLKTR